jgi:hypothetical protein
MLRVSTDDRRGSKYVSSTDTGPLDEPLWSIWINGRINGHNLHENTFMWILSSAGNHVKAIFVSVLIRVRFYRIR